MEERNIDDIASIKKISYTCEKCNYFTNKLDSYKKHCNSVLHKTGKRKTRSDKLTENYKCNICDYECNHKMNMKLHKLRNHATIEEKIKEFKYYCVSCDFGEFNQNLYNKHLTTNKHKMRANK